MHPFTQRKIEEGRSLYVAMCKGKVPQRSIRSKHGKGKDYRNTGIVMGQGTSYHGAINID
jgi:hypothetical protein